MAATPCGRRGVTFHALDVSRETPDVTPCRASAPMPAVPTRLARNARCDTVSHLTAAGCIRHHCLPPLLEKSRFYLPAGGPRPLSSPDLPEQVTYLFRCKLAASQCVCIRGDIWRASFSPSADFPGQSRNGGTSGQEEFGQARPDHRTHNHIK